MLSPYDSALLQVAMQNGAINSEDMMEVVNFKVRQAPGASISDLLVDRGLMSEATVAKLAKQIDPGFAASQSHKFRPITGRTPPHPAPIQPPDPWQSPGVGSLSATTAAPRPSPENHQRTPLWPQPVLDGPQGMPDTRPANPIQQAAPDATTERVPLQPLKTQAKKAYRWPIEIGSSIGNYTVKSVLGKGGMGQVFRVRHERLERDYALKVLLPAGASNPRLLARFRHEARATARLRHPNIVSVHEVGEDDGINFFTMDIVDGQPLSDAIRSTPLAVDVVADMMRKITGALHHAHREGVIHRDMKPSNIILSKEGEPFVMDFGLAKELHAETRLTRTGTAVGTLAYMPPEQAQGRRDLIGPKADIYSLGVTLYECLTGKLPFVADSAPVLIAKLINEEPIPPHRRDPSVPEAISLITMQAMAKDPARRYGTAMDLCRDLERFLDGEPIAAQGVSLWEVVLNRARKNKPAAVLSLVLVVLVVGIVAWFSWRNYQQKRAFDIKLAEAEAFEESGDWDAALETYNMLIGQNPQDGRPHLGVDRVRGELAAAQALRAALFVREGQDLLRERDRIEQLLEADRRWVSKVGSEVDPAAPVEAKQELFEAREALREREWKAIELRARAVAKFHRGLGLDPGNGLARDELRRLYWEEYGAAESGGDLEALPGLKAQLELYSDGEAGLDAGGSFQLSSTPEGAEAFLFRFEDQGLRRVPVPFHPLRGRVETLGSPQAQGVEGPDVLALAGSNSLGRTPLPRIELEQGSYLLVLRRPGQRDTRLPLYIGRGSEWLNNLRLLSEQEIGEDFVYVPADNALLGGDRQAFQSLTRNPDKPETFVDGYLIGAHEITQAAYAEFLEHQDCGRDGVDLRFVPRRSDVSGPLWTRGPDAWSFEGDPQLPVHNISHADAVAYCAWRSHREGISYRLPTSEEWEKAARGVDGRFFVWGNEFEASFCLNGFGRPGGAPLEAVGSYPYDSSVYGVQDLCGSVREFCENRFRYVDLPLYGREESTLMEVRGGAWTYMTEVTYMRLCTRLAYPDTRVRPFFGFRLVKELPNP